MDEIPISPFLQNYLQIILEQNFGGENQFLCDFSLLLDEQIPLINDDTVLFSKFSKTLIQQISLQNDENSLLLHLTVFNKLQQAFRSISSDSCTKNILDLFLLFFDLDNVDVKTSIISILTQYLPINTNLVANIFFQKIGNLSNVLFLHNSLISSYLCFVNQLLSFQILGVDSMNIIFQQIHFFATHSHDLKIHQALIQIISKALNFSKSSFLLSFNEISLQTIEILFIKSDDNNLYSLLNSILFISSFNYDLIPIFFEKFDILLFTKIVNFGSSILGIISVQIIHNFIMNRMTNKILSLNYIKFFDNLLETCIFDIKKEIVLCLAHVVELSMIEQSITLLLNQNLILHFVEILSALSTADLSVILSSLVSALRQIKNIYIIHFKQIQIIFLDSNILAVLESLEMDNENVLANYHNLKEILSIPSEE